MSADDLKASLPFVWPVLAALAILVRAERRTDGPMPMPPLLALAGLGLSVLSSWILWPGMPDREIFAGAVRLDAFGLFLAGLSGLIGLATVLLSIGYLKRLARNHSEYYVLVLFGTAGMIIMGLSTNFVSVLFGLEVMSMSLYVLCGFFRDRSTSIESSIKYFLTGSFATALLLFGMGLVYGGTGSLDLIDMGRAIFRGEGGALVTLGTGFLVAGFAFKVAAVPFHMWLPDVYEGAPTPVTGFMATGVKVAAFGAMIRVFCEVYQGDDPTNPAIRDMLWWIAVITMSVGNVSALAQRSVKRMLAYSSIAHAGYLLVAIVVMMGVRDANGVVLFSDSESVRGVLYYLLAYALATLGAFGVLSSWERDGGGGLDYTDLAGLRSRYPFASLALAAFMLSLAGIPGTAGFIGKFIVFGAAVDAGQLVPDESFVLLAVLGILNSLVALYYYLRVPIQLFVEPMTQGERDKRKQPGPGLAFTAVIGVALIGTLWLGFGPDLFGLGIGVEPALEMVKGALESLR